MNEPATPLEAALAYADWSYGHSAELRDFFKGVHGRPSRGAKLMGCTEFETMPHCAMRILAAEVVSLQMQLQARG